MKDYSKKMQAQIASVNKKKEKTKIKKFLRGSTVLSELKTEKYSSQREIYDTTDGGEGLGKFSAQRGICESADSGEGLEQYSSQRKIYDTIDSGEGLEKSSIQKDIGDTIKFDARNLSKQSEKAKTKALELMKSTDCKQDFCYHISQKILAENHIFSSVQSGTIFVYNQKLGFFEKKDYQMFAVFLRSFFANRSDIDKQLRPPVIKEIYERVKTTPDIQINLDEFEPYQKLLNVKNGVINTGTLEFLPHSPEYKFLNVIPIDYRETAGNAERFTSVLQSVFEDPDNRLLFLESFSYLVSNFYGEKICFVYLGKSGTGKSMMLRLITLFLGGIENIATIPLNKFRDRFALAELYGRKVNLAGELSADKLSSTDAIKNVIGNDIIDAEFKGKNHFSFQCKVKCVFASNFMIELDSNAKEPAFFKRFCFIEFGKPVDVDKQVPFFERILLEEEGSAILSIIVKTLHNLSRKNFKFTNSKQSDQLKQKFMNSGDTVQHFIEECCDIHDDECMFTPNISLYEAYRSYCKLNCFEFLTSIKFIKAVGVQTGLKKKKARDQGGSLKWGITGISMRNEIE